MGSNRNVKSTISIELRWSGIGTGLRHYTAPTELEVVAGWYGCYKDIAPTELTPAMGWRGRYKDIAPMELGGDVGRSQARLAWLPACRIGDGVRPRPTIPLS